MVQSMVNSTCPRSREQHILTSTDMDQHEREAPQGTQEEGDKGEDAGDNPTFSLAGPGASNPASNAYVGDLYRQYNPQYGKEVDSPTWSLAQPLPHIVRPGMQHGALPEDRKEDKQAGQNGNGPGPDKPDNSQGSEDGFFNKWSKFRHKIREPLAEWLGVGYIRNFIISLANIGRR